MSVDEKLNAAINNVKSKTGTTCPAGLDYRINFDLVKRLERSMAGKYETLDPVVEYPKQKHDVMNMRDLYDLYYYAVTRRGDVVRHFVCFWSEMMSLKSFVRVALCTLIAVLMLGSGKAKAMEMEILTPSEFTHTYMKTRPTVSKWNTGLFPQSTLEWIIRHENLLRDKVSLVMQDKPVPFMPKNVFCSSADFVHGRAACMAVTGINTAHLRYEIHLNPQMLHVWSRFDVNQHLANMNRYTREHNFDGMAYEIVAVMQFIIENF